MYKIFLLVTLFCHTLFAQKSTPETLGDIFLVLLPTSAYVQTLYNEDIEGTQELTYSLVTALSVTYTLKYSVAKERPNAEDTLSFPSGHSSFTFAASTYIWRRYGFHYAFLPYLASCYTAYSRVYAKKHDSVDVIAGSFIGIVAALYFTTSYKKVTLQPLTKSGYEGVVVNYTW